MTSKNTKMCSVRLEESVFSEFKKFCIKNDVTIKDSITNLIKILLESEVKENDRGENLLDVQKA